MTLDLTFEELKELWSTLMSVPDLTDKSLKLKITLAMKEASKEMKSFVTLQTGGKL
jgi:hypothetical protein